MAATRLPMPLAVRSRTPDGAPSVTRPAKPSALNLTIDGAEFQTVKILSKYALREHLGPLLFSLTALTSLLLLNYIAKNIGNLVGKGLPWSVIGEFVGLSVPFTFAMTLPMAVLVAVLYAFSRLAAENEITAMKASGVSLARLLIPTLVAASALSLFMIAFNDQVLPRSNHQLRTLMEDIARKKPTFALHAQVINEVSPGKLYLRAGQLDESSDRMREVVIYDLGDASRRRTIYADSGTMGLTAEGDLEAQSLSRRHTGRAEGEPRRAAAHLLYGEPCACPGCRQYAHSVDERHVQERARDVGVRDAAGGRRRRAGRRRGSSGDALPDSQRRAHRGDRHECHSTTASGWAEQPLPTQTERRSAVLRSARQGDPGTSRRHHAGWGQPSRDDCSGAGASEPRASVCGSSGSRAVRRSAAVRRGLPPSAGVPSPVHAAPPPIPPMNARPTFAPPPRPTTISQVIPISAVATLNTLSASLDADRARIEDNRRTNATYDVEIQKKFAISVACAIFVLLGAPIALRFPRGGVGLVIGVSFAVFGLYYVGLIAGEPLAQNGTVSPFWAMWASNVIFLVVGLALLARVGRSRSTVARR